MTADGPSCPILNPEELPRPVEAVAKSAWYNSRAVDADGLAARP